VTTSSSSEKETLKAALDGVLGGIIEEPTPQPPATDALTSLLLGALAPALGALASLLRTALLPIFAIGTWALLIWAIVRCCFATPGKVAMSLEDLQAGLSLNSARSERGLLYDSTDAPEDDPAYEKLEDEPLSHDSKYTNANSAAYAQLEDEDEAEAEAAAAAAAAAAADAAADDEDDDDEEAWDEDAEGEADTPMSLMAAPPPLLIPTPSDSPPKEHSKVRSPPRLLLEPRKPVRRSLPEMRSRLRHVGRTTPRGGTTPRGFSGATAAIPAAPLALDESATPRTLYLSKLSTANTPSGVSDFLEEARAKLRRSKSRKPRLTYADVDKTPLPHEGYFRRDPRVPPLPMGLMNFPQNNPMLLVDAAPLPAPGGMGYAPNMGYAPPEEDYDA
jgi:hypothetical protein